MPTDNRTSRNGIQPVFVTTNTIEYALASSKRPGESATIRGKKVTIAAINPTIAAANPTNAAQAFQTCPSLLLQPLGAGGDGVWTGSLSDRLGFRNVRMA